MDNAVAMVQSYLRLNGYFTITEFPVIQSMRHGGHRVATDLDILAFRFPRAGSLITRSGSSSVHDSTIARTDPALGLAPEEPDMIIGEVKEGRAELNKGAREPAVLRAALARFGCCDEHEVDALVDDLLRRGRATAAEGHHIRLVAFGVSRDPDPAGYHAILFRDVFSYLTEFLKEHWDTVGVAEFKDPVMAQLALMLKSGFHA